MPKYTIILASGSGERAKNTINHIPKQFIKIKNKQILSHTISRIKNYAPNSKIILSILPEYKSFLDKDYECYKDILFANGGKTRAESVKNALSLIKNYNDYDLLAIHDGVRPFFSKKTFEKLKKEAIKKNNAIPFVFINESTRFIIDDNNSEFVERSKIVKLQTPQFFNIKKIKYAYDNFFSPYLTDDSRILELSGEKINLIEGDYNNIKITYDYDLLLVKQLLEI